MLVLCTQLAWPTWIKAKLFPAASLATLNLDFGGLGCFGSSGVTWVFSLALPLIVVVAIGVVYGAVWVSSLIRRMGTSGRMYAVLLDVLDRFRKYPLRIESWVWSASSSKLVLAFLSMIYVFAVRTSLDVFKCITLLDQKVLMSDTSVSCEDSNYSRRQALGIVALCVYGAGIPMVLFTVLWVSRYVVVTVNANACVCGCVRVRVCAGLALVSDGVWLCGRSLCCVLFGVLCVVGTKLLWISTIDFGVNVVRRCRRTHSSLSSTGCQLCTLTSVRVVCFGVW